MQARASVTMAAPARVPNKSPSWCSRHIKRLSEERNGSDGVGPLAVSPAKMPANRRQGACAPSMNEIVVIGGGLAGVEAAWQAAEAGARVRLYEMRPVKQTPAHRTDKLAEIVCSNSLKSDEAGSASHLLKEELRRANSLVMDVADHTRVPAGAALAVDRQQFAECITARIESHPKIDIVRAEVAAI